MLHVCGHKRPLVLGHMIRRALAKARYATHGPPPSTINREIIKTQASPFHGIFRFSENNLQFGLGATRCCGDEAYQRRHLPHTFVHNVERQRAEFLHVARRERPPRIHRRGKNAVPHLGQRSIFVADERVEGRAGRLEDQ
ncbi:hypothetical protein BC937DRAFT_93610 [Endogone sp. FLAS-F59071]|nr:hypothetical protein BC937DRAFT_93610 [Endogone sp. FLAS-F59071]|eukprot:RUS14581.1 hypothetical protein BC937DRAFT_93610 [Endogone sp. FLAS-F59071]